MTLPGVIRASIAGGAITVVSSVVCLVRTPAAGQLAALSGVVIDGQTQRPVPDATVVVSRRGVGSLTDPAAELTDSSGRFVFVGVPAGPECVVTADKAGYSRASYGSFAGSDGFSLAAGEWRREVQLVLWRYSSISGSVTAGNDDPVEGARVQVFRESLIAGRERPVAGPIVETDDRGAYRVAALTPGQYIVAVMPAARDASTTASVQDAPEAPRYTRTFYPDSFSMTGAERLALSQGEGREAVNVHLAPTPVFRLSGTVVPVWMASDLVLQLVAKEDHDLGAWAPLATGSLTASGAFSFSGAPSGQYEVIATNRATRLRLVPLAGILYPDAASDGETHAPVRMVGGVPSDTAVTYSYEALVLKEPNTSAWGRAEVRVESADRSGLIVPLQHGTTLSGRLVTESGSPPVLNRPLYADPADGDPTRGLVLGDLDGDAFSISGVPPGHYFLRSSPAGGLVTSITWEGRDMSHAPFDTTSGGNIGGVVVTLATTGGGIRGRVGRAPDASHTDRTIVVMFPADPDQWKHFGLTPPLLRLVEVEAPDETYRFSRVAPGDYNVAAIAVGVDFQWPSEATLTMIARRAIRVTVAGAENRTLDLTAQRLR